MLLLFFIPYTGSLFPLVLNIKLHVYVNFDAKFHVGPDYIQQLVITYDNPSDYFLRSRDDSRTLQTSQRGFALFGDRAFSMAADDVWNSLPHSIRHSSS